MYPDINVFKHGPRSSRSCSSMWARKAFAVAELGAPSTLTCNAFARGPKELSLVQVASLKLRVQS